MKTMTPDEIESLRAALQVAAADGNWCGQAAFAIWQLRNDCNQKGEQIAKLAAALSTALGK